MDSFSRNTGNNFNNSHKMKTGTKSLLFGAHQFILHPIFVAAAWIKLYGFPFDLRIWVAFLVHDFGYWGKPNMDGTEGERHPETGAKIMHWLFDGWDVEEMTEMFPTIQRFAELRREKWYPVLISRENNIAVFQRKVLSKKWYNFTLLHSRHYAKSIGLQPSKLCYADKLAFVLTPNCIYLPCTTATGEIYEYMQRATRPTTNKLLWLYRAKLHTLEYVLEHYHNDKPDTWTKDRTDDPLLLLREDTYSNEDINEMTGKLIREQYKNEQA